MKIEIDTKNDSRQEIMSVIRLLQNSIGEDQREIFNINNEIDEVKEKIKTAKSEEGYVNLFAPNEKLEEKEEPISEEQSSSDSGGFLGDFFSTNETSIEEQNNRNDSQEQINNSEKSGFIEGNFDSQNQDDIQDDDQDKNDDEDKPRVTLY